MPSLDGEKCIIHRNKLLYISSIYTGHLVLAKCMYRREKYRRNVCAGENAKGNITNCDFEKNGERPIHQASIPHFSVHDECFLLLQLG